MVAASDIGVAMWGLGGKNDDKECNTWKRPADWDPTDGATSPLENSPHNMLVVGATATSNKWKFVSCKGKASSSNVSKCPIKGKLKNYSVEEDAKESVVSHLIGVLAEGEAVAADAVDTKGVDHNSSFVRRAICGSD